MESARRAALAGVGDIVGGRAVVSIDGLKNIQRFMKLRNPKIGDINLDRLVDESILRDLEKSGVLEQTLSVKGAAR